MGKKATVAYHIKRQKDRAAKNDNTMEDENCAGVENMPMFLAFFINVIQIKTCSFRYLFRNSDKELGTGSIIFCPVL